MHRGKAAPHLTQTTPRRIDLVLDGPIVFERDSSLGIAGIARQMYSILGIYVVTAIEISRDSILFTGKMKNAPVVARMIRCGSDKRFISKRWGRDQWNVVVGAEAARVSSPRFENFTTPLVLYRFVSVGDGEHVVFAHRARGCVLSKMMLRATRGLTCDPLAFVLDRLRQYTASFLVMLEGMHEMCVLHHGLDATSVSVDVAGAFVSDWSGAIIATEEFDADKPCDLWSYNALRLVKVILDEFSAVARMLRGDDVCLDAYMPSICDVVGPLLDFKPRGATATLDMFDRSIVEMTAYDESFLVSHLRLGYMVKRLDEVAASRRAKW